LTSQNCTISRSLPGSCAPNWLQGKPTNRKVLIAQLALQLLEPGVLRRQAATARHIHRERDLAAQSAQQVG